MIEIQELTAILNVNIIQFVLELIFIALEIPVPEILSTSISIRSSIKTRHIITIPKNRVVLQSNVIKASVAILRSTAIISSILNSFLFWLCLFVVYDGLMDR